MADRQIFGSSLKRPWALVVFGSNAPIGKRPGTSVYFLTDDCGDHYLGGAVEYYAKRAKLKLVDGRYVTVQQAEPARWHYRYTHAKRIPKSDVLHIFAIENKSPFVGPSKDWIRRARKALPITAAESIAA